jgi:ABC-type lipopolysaccharide export system ATPase subunit
VTCAEHLDAVARRYPEAEVDSAVDVLGLMDLFDRKPGQLSGGERRRMEMGLALARRPKCLVADEPFLGIMPGDGEIIQRALRQLADSGCAIVVTGHEVRDLLDLADEVLCQVAGATHMLGSPDRARQHDQFRREYLAGHLLSGVEF